MEGPTRQGVTSMSGETSTVESPFPEQFTDTDWSRYVREGRDIVEQETHLQFALGDLTLKMIPCRYHEGDHGVGRVLQAYADEIGIPYDTLKGYRHMALAWPKDKRAPHVGFGIHMALDALPDRFERIHKPPDGKERWTVDLAREHAGRRGRAPRDTHETLREVRKLLREDEVAAAAVNEMVTHRPGIAEQVVTNPDAQSAIRQAHAEIARRSATQRSPRPGTGQPGRDDDREAPRSQPLPRREPLADDTVVSRQVLELLGLGVAFCVGMQELVPSLRVSELNDRARKAIEDNHRRVRAVVDWCDTVIATGDSSMDEQLARLLEGGNSS